MAIISMFYGIIISMYYLDQQQHHRAHIHVKYQEQEAVIAIPDGSILDGELRANKLKLVQAWIEIHLKILWLIGSWQVRVSPYSKLIR